MNHDEIIVGVVGSRTFTNYQLLETTLNNIKEGKIVKIVSGGGRGADQLGERYASEYGIPAIVFNANWSLGKHAGLMRNTNIVKHSDLIIAFWDGKSPGTKDTIDKATKMNKKLKIISF